MDELENAYSVLCIWQDERTILYRDANRESHPQRSSEQRSAVSKCMFTWHTRPLDSSACCWKDIPWIGRRGGGDLGCNSCVILSSRHKLLKTPLEHKGRAKPFLLMAASALTCSRTIPLFQEMNTLPIWLFIPFLVWLFSKGRPCPAHKQIRVPSFGTPA